MTLPEDELSTIDGSCFNVGLDEGVGDSRVFRDLEYAFCLQHVRRGSRILDVGASRPWFLRALERRNCKVITIDVSPKEIRPHHSAKIESSIATLTNLPFANSSFDCVICVSTLEHLRNDEDIDGMREFLRVAREAIFFVPIRPTSQNWSPFDPDHERWYDENLVQTRLLAGWKVLRRSTIAVWDRGFNGWIREDGLFLRK